MTSGEGTIEILLENLWSFLNQHHDHTSAEVYYGVPRVNKANHTLEIDYAYSDDTTPTEWAIKPKAVTQWQEKNPFERGKVDLTKCETGDILISALGAVMLYDRPATEREYLEHRVKYVVVDGEFNRDKFGEGTRTDDGFVFAKKRMPETDHDIVMVIKRNHIENMNPVESCIQLWLDAEEANRNEDEWGAEEFKVAFQEKFDNLKEYEKEYVKSYLEDIAG